MKASDLVGAHLDAAVAQAEGHEYELVGERVIATRLNWSTPIVTRLVFAPSTSWSLGGPIIERERIEMKVDLVMDSESDPTDPELNRTVWLARLWKSREAKGFGPTPLIAAMRAYVMSKLGEETDLG